MKQALIPTSESGFTLLELLVAMTLFALVGLGAHGLLQSSFQTSAKAKQQAEKLAQLQTAMMMLAQDIEQMDMASLRQTQVGSFSFIRYGWDNPLRFARSDRVAVSYTLQGTDWIRSYAPASHTDAATHKQVMLRHIQQVHMQPLHGAVEVTLETVAFGTIRRVMEVPGATP